MPLHVQRRLFQRGDRVLIGLSGGPDSLALTHWLAAHRGELGVGLHACHVHHGMRGRRADEDCEFLREWCAAQGVPLSVARADVPGLAAARRISVEEAGRAARYAAFAEAAAAAACGKVATAHTADDQVETVLFRLLRGTGTDGLGGIPERRPLSPTPGAPEVIRPLLHAWRSEVEEYVREHGLAPLEDDTNRDTRYQRSRIRLEVLPALLEAAPGLKQNLLRLSEQAAAEGAFLDRLAGEVLQSALVPEPPSPWPWSRGVPGVVLATDALRRADPVLARRALRLALRRAGGFEVEVDRALLERLEHLLRSPGTVEVPGAPLAARSRDGQLRLEAERAPGAPPEAVELLAPGEIAAGGWSVRVRVEAGPRPGDPHRGPLSAVLDQAAVRLPLRLRAPRRGDRFHPLNAPGSRLLSDLFLDRRIAAPERPYWPVLEDAEGIVWAPGVATAHRARIHEETTACWEVSLVPEAP